VTLPGGFPRAGWGPGQVGAVASASARWLPLTRRILPVKVAPPVRVAREGRLRKMTHPVLEAADLGQPQAFS